ncbi:MAG: nickel pincer cofactor biosynthesis protein LarB [Ignavibacteria bacterium]|nr:nickel pincer cofactor biosynthesis protein LarB [Ignavibacteria bacterium]
MKKNLKNILLDFKNSKIELDDVLNFIKEQEKIVEIEFATLDANRERRTAIPEIIFCENKSTQKIIEIIQKLYAENQLVIGTRCSEEKLKLIKKKYPKGKYSFEGKAFYIGKPSKKISGKVALITAGTTDVPVLEEASIVLEALGIDHEKFYDIGVAGIHRLFSKYEKINSCDVLIVAAGMEGALPSVIGGMFSQPIIAIPVSVGYGTALSGFTALFAMLTSCSPGITVVNINNGVGAASSAVKILRLIENKVGKD